MRRKLTFRYGSYCTLRPVNTGLAGLTIVVHLPWSIYRHTIARTHRLSWEDYSATKRQDIFVLLKLLSFFMLYIASRVLIRGAAIRRKRARVDQSTGFVAIPFPRCFPSR